MEEVDLGKVEAKLWGTMVDAVVAAQKMLDTTMQEVNFADSALSSEGIVAYNEACVKVARAMKMIGESE